MKKAAAAVYNQPSRFVCSLRHMVCHSLLVWIVSVDVATRTETSIKQRKCHSLFGRRSQAGHFQAICLMQMASFLHFWRILIEKASKSYDSLWVIKNDSLYDISDLSKTCRETICIPYSKVWWLKREIIIKLSATLLNYIVVEFDTFN